MWKKWFGRRVAALQPQAPEDSTQVFLHAVEEARGREELFKPLFEQLSFALRTAESTVPIDRATVPLNLTMGPAKIKELSAQIKLSPFLKNNIQALVHHFREDQRDLKNAERAAELHADQPYLQVRGEAILLVQGLFHFMSAGREQFRDYPLFYQLFDAGTGLLPSLAPAVPDELQFFLSDAPADETPIAAASLQLEPDADMRSPETVLKLIGVSPMTLEVGMDLVPLIDPAMGGDLMDRVLPMRLDVALDMGFVMPGMQFKDNATLRPNGYQIRVRGNVVAVGELMVGYHLAVENPSEEASGAALVGFPTSDPVLGRPATWVTRAEGQRASKLGFTVLDPANVLLSHMDEVVRAHAHEILSLDEVSLMLDNMRTRAPVTVDAVIPEKLELPDYHKVLTNLLRERVSIRDQATILEKLAHSAKPVHPFYLADRFGEQRASIESIMLMEMTAQVRPLTDPMILTEMVRSALSRQICADLADEHGTLDVVLLSAQVEQVVLDGLQTTAMGQVLNLKPATRELLVNRLVAECGRMERPVVLCDPRIRPFVRQLTTRALPRLAVLSQAELHPQFRIQTVGTVLMVEN
ncbi:MAG: flhA [Cyanobacteria bacterium RYN_339]|nr:flhA [Cyanobacteria bacterium RYN_339]